MLTAGGIVVSHETVRHWALKFGQVFWNLRQDCRVSSLL
jgi:transposase-like protein